jgi:hypothetical protein
MGIPPEFAAGEKPSSAAGLATRARSKPVGYFKPGVLDLVQNVQIVQPLRSVQSPKAFQHRRTVRP